MSGWSNMSIKYRLIISVMIVLILLMSAFVYDFYSRQSRFLERENRDSAITSTGSSTLNDTKIIRTMI
ncbi:MAG: hypothetical protein WCV63_05750 [Negativicutes bacterium]|jgi:hypothetical protein